MKWLERVRHTAAEEWFFARLSPDDPAAELAPERCYVSARLTSMRVSNARVGTRRYHASATGLVSVESRAGERAEFMTVTKPVALDADPAHLDRLVTVDKPLMGPVPYRGGDVGIELGVFSMPTVDLLEPYLGLVHEIAEFAGIGTLTGATKLLSTAKSALDLAFGAGAEPELEIGLSSHLQRPMAGHYCVVQAPRDDPGLAGVRLGRDNRLEKTDGSAVRQAYLAFELGRHERRDTWSSIPDLQMRYQDVRDAVRSDNLVRAKAAVEVFGRAAVMSPDLLAADGGRLRDLVAGEVTEAFRSTPTSAAGAGAELPEFAELPLYG
jgi:hypothetical protein